MKNLAVATVFALGLGVSSTSFAQHFEDFESYSVPTSGLIVSGPFEFSAVTPAPWLYVGHDIFGTGKALRWCHAMNIDVKIPSTTMQFDLTVATPTPVTVFAYDHNGTLGTVYPPGPFGPGQHQVMITAGPDARVELRGGDCETWIDNVGVY
ncbi:MAG: hypothetical protein AAF602_08730 [Myxococcota bacterium]